MTVAIRTLIHEWMVPRMNARQMRVEVIKGNAASVRVFEKNGFVLEERGSSDNSGNLQDVLWWRHTDACESTKTNNRFRMTLADRIG